MSKDITIQQGGVAKQMSGVTKITTAAIGIGSAVGWLPEDETGKRDKQITANGEYHPDLDATYAFDNVSVNVPGGVGGPPGSVGSVIIGKDEQGRTYIISVGEDGFIRRERPGTSHRLVTSDGDGIAGSDESAIIAYETYEMEVPS